MFIPSFIGRYHLLGWFEKPFGPGEFGYFAGFGQ
jgi:hypothetical protein